MSPVLYNEHDGVDQARIRADQSDPWVMYLVAPGRPRTTGGEILAQAATASALCARRYVSEPAWSERFEAWRRTSFRKVCLRASIEQLREVESLDHARCGEVLCLPPRRRSDAEPALAQLAAHAGGPLLASDAEHLPSPGAMLVLVRSELRMTLGKACAQVGHIALIAMELHSREAVETWAHAGYPAAVRLLDAQSLDRAKRDLHVAAVRDAGLSQVTPGSETVLALSPGAQIPAWLARAARAVE
jgi:peptidyl-tRNA hydrolase